MQCLLSSSHLIPKTLIIQIQCLVGAFNVHMKFLLQKKKNVPMKFKTCAYKCSRRSASFENSSHSQLIESLTHRSLKLINQESCNQSPNLAESVIQASRVVTLKSTYKSKRVGLDNKLLESCDLYTKNLGLNKFFENITQ